MLLLALRLDHQHADVRLRERLAVPASELPAALAVLREHVAEGAILSTCNRTELYAVVGHRDSGRRAVLHFLAEVSGAPVEEFGPALVEAWQEDAVRHLCRVAAGLESLVIGEHQILGQVRMAADAARAAGSAGPILGRLFSDALAFGKRARTESGIGQSAASVGTAGVDVARQALGQLDECTALVVGAGKMATLAARGLSARRCGRLLVTTRRYERAQVLAEQVGGEAVPFEQRSDAIARCDLVMSATSASGYVLDEAAVRAAIASRPERRLVLVDVAVPRDIEPSIADLPGCALYNIDDLVATQQANIAARRLEAEKVEATIGPAVERFMAWWAGRDVAPVIAELVARAEEIRAAETERVLTRLGPLSEREREAVNAMTTAIVGKLLHGPIIQLKRRGGRHDTSVYLHAVRELFGLPGSAGLGGRSDVLAEPEGDGPTIALG
ncbi:MAG: glutamyl-tRNA reductase [Chloroflexi bacterium]|nr:glutamyl-tRNA reductase [Chloroflexota bacterium]